MYLEDRIELADHIFYLYSYASKSKNVTYSILYTADSTRCTILSFTSEPISKQESMPQILRLHNETLSRLFKAARSNPQKPIEALLKELEELKPIYNNSSSDNNSQINKDFTVKEFFIKNLPPFATHASFIDGDNIQLFVIDNNSKNSNNIIKNNIVLLKKLIDENIDKLYSLMGECKNSIVTIGDKHYFIYPLSKQKRVILITSQSVPLGLASKALDSFQKALIEYLDHNK